MSFINTTTTISAGTGIVYTNGSNISNIEIDKSLIEYIDLLYQLISIDMNYDKFKDLSTSEKQAFIRDIKIKKLLDNAIPEN
jgi:hypothetical protein